MVNADGTYLDHNPNFDHNEPKHFDIDSKLALSTAPSWGKNSTKPSQLYMDTVAISLLIISRFMNYLTMTAGVE